MSKKRQLEKIDDENSSDEHTIPTKSRKTESHTNDDKPKLPKILDGLYYEVIKYDKATDSVEARCVNCTKKKTIIRGQRTSTGNFHTHYSRLHAEKSDDVKIYCDEKKDGKPSIERKAKVQSILPFATLDSTKVIDYLFNCFVKICLVISNNKKIFNFITDS